MSVWYVGGGDSTEALYVLEVTATAAGIVISC